jgi:hypothetical protein
VDGDPKPGWVDRDWKRFIAKGELDSFFLMAGKTKIIGRFIFLEYGSGLS